MTGSHGDRPPFSGIGGDVDVRGVCEAVGLPATYPTQSLYGNFILPALAAEFGDGEVRATHSPQFDPVIQEQFGVENFADGVFGQRVCALLEGDDQAMRDKTECGLCAVRPTPMHGWPWSG